MSSEQNSLEVIEIINDQWKWYITFGHPVV